MHVIILSLCLVVFLAIAPNRAQSEDLKIGYVDTQRLLDESAFGKRVREEMNAHVQSRQQIIDLEEGELKKIQDDLTRQGPVLSDKARGEKEEAFQKKLAEYQRKVSELQREIQSKKIEKLKEFNDQMEQMAKKIAEADGFSIILANDPEQGTLLYARPTMNLTERLIQELNKLDKMDKEKQEEDKGK